MNSIVWVFIILTQGHMLEVGGFKDEETCNSTREQIKIQREAIGFGDSKERTYMLTKHFETTKCFMLWKK